MSRVERTDIVYGIRAQDAGASAAFSRVGSAAAKMQKDIEKAGASKALKEILSPSDSANRGLFGLASAGALAALGGKLNQFADAATEIELAFQRGEVSAARMVGELAKAIPIYGKIIDAGNKFGRILDGTNIREARENDAQQSRDIVGNALVGLRGTTSTEEAARLRDEAQSQVAGQIEAARRASRNMGVIDTLTGGQVKLNDELKGLRERQRLIDVESNAAMARLAKEAEAEKQFKEQVLQSRLVDERQQARIILDEKIRLADEENKELIARAIDNTRKIVQRRREFEIQDQRDALTERQAELEKTIGQYQPARMGATAAAITDVGRGAVLAGMERRSSDPSVTVLRKSQTELEQIKGLLKSMDERQKQLSRNRALGQDETIF